MGQGDEPQTIQIVRQGETTLYWFLLIHYNGLGLKIARFGTVSAVPGGNLGCAKLRGIMPNCVNFSNHCELTKNAAALARFAILTCAACGSPPCPVFLFIHYNLLGYRCSGWNIEKAT